MSGEILELFKLAKKGTPYNPSIEKEINIDDISNSYVIHIDINNSYNNACINCPNHPNNGGSRICNCTLGITPITC